MINTGDLFDFEPDTSELTSSYILKGLDITKVDVLALGVFDLKAGVERLKKMAERSSVDFICGNIDGYLPYVRYLKNGQKVLVTSVIDPEFAKNAGLKIDKIKNPITIINRIGETIDHDLYIVVLHSSKIRSAELIGKTKGVDLFINGGWPLVYQTVQSVKETPLLYNNSSGGKFVAYVDCKLGGAAKPVEIGAPVVIRADIKTVSQDEKIVELLRQYDSERVLYFKKRETQRKLEIIKNTRLGMYLGDKSCNSCHPKIYQKWKNTPHARAISSLESKNKNFDQDCLVCHVTGMENLGTAGGFLSTEKTPWMVNVQCEACHGPGAEHVQNNKIKPLYKAGRDICLKCHTGVTDPDFNYEKGLVEGVHSLGAGK